MTKSFKHESAGEIGLVSRAQSYVKRLGAILSGPLDCRAIQFFHANLMTCIEDYVIRGRRFDEVNVDDLNATWITTFHAVSEGDAKQLDDLDDATSELLLRGSEPPIGSIAKSYQRRRHRRGSSALLKTTDAHAQLSTRRRA